MSNELISVKRHRIPAYIELAWRHFVAVNEISEQQGQASPVHS